MIRKKQHVYRKEINKNVSYFNIHDIPRLSIHTYNRVLKDITCRNYVKDRSFYRQGLCLSGIINQADCAWFMNECRDMERLLSVQTKES